MALESVTEKIEEEKLSQEEDDGTFSDKESQSRSSYSRKKKNDNREENKAREEDRILEVEKVARKFQDHMVMPQGVSHCLVDPDEAVYSNSIFSRDIMSRLKSDFRGFDESKIQ